MCMDSYPDITGLLTDWSRGDPEALEKLIPLVLDELRRLAKAYFAQQPPDHTLQPTALVNELYLRLVGRRRMRWRDRTDFYAFAAKTMRNLLVDHARARHTGKRGAGVAKLPLEQAEKVAAGEEVDLLTLDEALRDLAALDPRQGRIVELRAFAGLSLRQTAAALEVSEATVSRDWASAKAFLYRRLKRTSP